MSENQLLNRHIQVIAQELSISTRNVGAAVTLLDDGATIPFIARYRKERTGNLDEVSLGAVRDRIARLRELDDRKTVVLKSLEERNQLTDDLRTAVLSAATMTILEDIYLPYRPKRRTRATKAREKGLEPLAETVYRQEPDVQPETEAGLYIDTDKGVATVQEALSGARDIIAEWISENSAVRSDVRRLFAETGRFCLRVVPGKEQTGAKYRDYFDWNEPVKTAPSHRILAMRRGENEGILSLSVEIVQETALDLIAKRVIRAANACSEQVRLAVADGFRRLLAPSMETEIRQETRQRADAEAIRVFAENIRQLLLAPPLGRKRVLAVDPGFRTGCKTVCLDSQGKLEHVCTIFPHNGGSASDDAAETVRDLVNRYRIEAIAIGNGTAGRETETFFRVLDLPGKPAVMMVNESGASVYSASAVAREEFPDQDITVRGAVSIGRRLMDPLSELVKIDPKSIGVGQYQHDVDQKALKLSLDNTVISCVNSVGVDVNTAGKQLLSYVSGLGPQLAANIVAYRDENGPFASRAELKKVARMGPKAFEQSAGFLRVTGGRNPLDASAVHPESYGIVRRMAADLGCSVQDLMQNPDLRKRIVLEKYITDTTGMPTLTDIVRELAQPGRDPRKTFEIFQFSDAVTSIDHLKPGMTLPGIITNITRFGVFVDIGVHQDGLVHISEMADSFVKNPADIVTVHQTVQVTVMTVDTERKRISLSLRRR
jgi:protein Tex